MSGEGGTVPMNVHALVHHLRVDWTKLASCVVAPVVTKRKIAQVLNACNEDYVNAPKIKYTLSSKYSSNDVIKMIHLQHLPL